MSIPYELAVEEDIELGHGTVTRTNPGGGADLTGNKIGIHTMLPGLYNVKDFGAAGDGVTDDTAAVAAAETQANTDGGALYFPEGTYLVNSFEIRVSVFGFGVGRSIIKQPLDDPTVVFGSIGSNVVLRDIEFNAVPDNGQFHRIETKTGATNIVLDNVKIHGFPGGYGLTLLNGPSNIKISNSHVEAGFWGLTMVDVTDVLISNTYIKTTGTRAALEIEPDTGLTAARIKLVNCVLDGNGTALQAAHLFNGGIAIEDVSFVGCIFRNATDGIRDYVIRGLQVVGCNFEDTITDLIYKHNTGVSDDNGTQSFAIWSGNIWAFEQTVKHWQTAPLTNYDFRTDPLTSGWTDISGVGTITHDTTNGLTGAGSVGAAGKAAKITVSENTKIIEQGFQVQENKIIVVKVTFKYNSVPDAFSAQARIVFRNSANADVTPLTVRPLALFPAATTWDTEWHEATLVAQVPATARTAQLRLGWFSNQIGEILIDNVEIIGAGAL